jgi:hypothetical protein
MSPHSSVRLISETNQLILLHAKTYMAIIILGVSAQNNHYFILSSNLIFLSFSSEMAYPPPPHKMAFKQNKDFAKICRFHLKSVSRFGVHYIKY